MNSAKMPAGGPRSFPAMNRQWVRMATALIASLVGSGTVVAAASASVTADGVAPFVATSFNPAAGDVCPMGASEGTFTWGATTVVVSGSVIDRPDPAGGPRCNDDRRVSIVYLTAYRGGAIMGVARYLADNGSTPFNFSWPRPGRIVAQVCRQEPTDPAPDYCGRPHEIPTD
jgi:hypothetical protein